MAVYFIRAGTDGPIKIGFTSRPIESRLPSIQSANSQHLTVLAVISGGRNREEALHGRFWAHRRKGEWFDPHPSLLHYVASLDPYSPDSGRIKYAPTRSWKKLATVRKRQIKKMWFDKAIPTDVEVGKLAQFNANTIKLNLGPSGRKCDIERMRKAGRAGGIASGKAKAKGRMPWPNIEKLWFSKLFRDELMDRINDSGYKPISYSAIHKRLGKRGVAVGRRAREQ